MMKQFQKTITKIAIKKYKNNVVHRKQWLQAKEQLTKKQKSSDYYKNLHKDKADST